MECKIKWTVFEEKKIIRFRRLYLHKINENNARGVVIF